LRARRHSMKVPHILIIVLIVSWALYYYIVSITVHECKECVKFTKIVLDSGDVPLSQLVTCSRQVEIIWVQGTQAMTKTCKRSLVIVQ